jgi:hypothetical protein
MIWPWSWRRCGGGKDCERMLLGVRIAILAEDFGGLFLDALHVAFWTLAGWDW